MALGAEQFSESAIACAVGWIAGRADALIGDELFVPWATAALYESQGLTFAVLGKLETEIANEFARRGFINPPNLKMFLACLTQRRATLKANAIQTP